MWVNLWYAGCFKAYYYNCLYVYSIPVYLCHYSLYIAIWICGSNMCLSHSVPVFTENVLQYIHH